MTPYSYENVGVGSSFSHDNGITPLYLTAHVMTCMVYHIAGNFGGKIIWQIAIIMAFGRFYLAVR